MEKLEWLGYPTVKKIRRYVYKNFDVIHERDGRTLHDRKDRVYASHRAVKITTTVQH